MELSLKPVWKWENPVRLGMALAVLLVAGTGVVIFLSAQRLAQAEARHRHTFEVINAIDDVLTTLLNAETGQRGYVITGDEKFLAPYQQAISAIEGRLQKVDELTRDNTTQQALVPRLKGAAHAKIEHLRAGVAAVHASGVEAGRPSLATELGKALMDDARGVIDEMRHAERASLHSRTLAVENSARTNTIVCFAGPLLALAILAGAFHLIRRDGIALQVAQSRLRQQSQLLEQILDGMSDGVVVADTSGKFLLWNPTATRIIGLGATDAGPSDWPATYGVFRSDQTTPLPWEQQPLIQACRGEETNRVELFIRNAHVPEGVFISISGRPLRDSEGVLQGGIVVFHDITARKRSEEQMRRLTEAAESANRAKSDFLAHMSHEIRTPISAVMGYAELLLEPKQTVSDQLDRISAIRRNSEHLLGVINDILDISRIEAGEIRLEMISCCPCRILSDVASIMRVRALEKGLKFEVASEGAVPQTIRTDPTRLRQILINLVGNAVKFTKSGNVRLTMRLQPAMDGTASMLRFDVVDTGIGMSQEVVRRVFEPFAQGDASTTRRFGGSGLGLYISRKLARMLGGNIDIESVPDLGTRSVLTIDPGSLDQVRMLSDCSEASIPEEPVTSSANVQIAGRILLAEDGIDNQRILGHYLKSAGADVTFADNGVVAYESAMAAVREGHPFDLILMDMQMPLMDGYTTTSKLRARGYRAPIVALTAHALAPDREKCLSSGCDDYLAKPLSKAQLLSTVQRHITSPAQAAAQVTGTLRSQAEDDEELRQFLPEFIRNLPAQVARLTDALRAVDLAALGAVVHQLKGSSGIYGFVQITEEAIIVERVVAEQQAFDDVTARVSELIDLVRRVEGYDRDAELTTSSGVAGTSDSSA